MKNKEDSEKRQK
jgi:hypothetical protein